MQKLLLLISLVIFPIYSTADSSAPSHQCTKPQPYDFDSEKSKADSYTVEVEEYKKCIQFFIDEQNRAILNHEKAANTAVKEWNNFTKYN